MTLSLFWLFLRCSNLYLTIDDKLILRWNKQGNPDFYIRKDLRERILVEEQA
jgi:hypothetical protein